MDISKSHTLLDTYMAMIKREVGSEEVYRNGMFKKRTKTKESMDVLVYLLKIISPDKINKLWPLYTTRLETGFASFVLDIVNDVIEKHSVKKYKVTMGIIMNPYGNKFILLLLDIVRVVYKIILCKDKDIEQKLNQTLKMVSESKNPKISREIVRSQWRRWTEEKKLENELFRNEAQTCARELIDKIDQLKQEKEMVDVEIQCFIRKHDLNLSRLEEYVSQVEHKHGLVSYMESGLSATMKSLQFCETLLETPMQEIDGSRLLNTSDGKFDLKKFIRDYFEMYRSQQSMQELFTTCGEKSKQPKCMTLITNLQSRISLTSQNVKEQLEKENQTLNELNKDFKMKTEKLMALVEWVQPPNFFQEPIMNPALIKLLGQPLVPKPYNPKESNIWTRFIAELRANRTRTPPEELYQRLPQITLEELFPLTCSRESNSDTAPSSSAQSESSVTSPTTSIPTSSINIRNVVFSPTNSTSTHDSPLASSSRLFPSSSNTSSSTPAHKQNESFLRNILLSKMAKYDAENIVATAGPGGVGGTANNSPTACLTDVMHTPSNLSQSTFNLSSSSLNLTNNRDVSDLLLSESRDLSNSVHEMNSFRRLSIVDCPIDHLLDDNAAANNHHRGAETTTMQSEMGAVTSRSNNAAIVLSPVSSMQEQSIQNRKPRKSLVNLIERFKKLKSAAANE